jgi:hypothetical protein
VSLFVGHGFTHERDNKHHLKFCMAKVMLFIYLVMPKMLNFKDVSPTLGLLVSVAVLGLNITFREAYNAGYFKFDIF